MSFLHDIRMTMNEAQNGCRLRLLYLKSQDMKASYHYILQETHYLAHDEEVTTKSFLTREPVQRNWVLPSSQTLTTAAIQQ